MNALVMQSPLEAIGDYFRRGGDSRELMYLVLTMLALLALLAIIHNTLGRRSKRTPANNPQKLFRDVLAKLSLGVKDRDLLLRLARDRRVKHPITLLLCPDIFGEHVAGWLAEREHEDARMSAKPSEKMEALCRTLFDERLRNQVSNSPNADRVEHRDGEPATVTPGSSPPDP